MSKVNFKIPNKYFYFGIIFLAAVLVILPIALCGIPSGNDLAQHFQFANTYYQSLINGDGFPNWSADENFGYGSIGIRFYPPLSYYVLAFFRIVCGTWFDAAWITFAFWMIVGCFGVYFWSRSWLSEKMSATAAVLYTIIPYHLNQLYISFLYADFAGASILPFCFAFQTRVFKRGNRSDILGLGISYAILILTHLPSAIIGSMCLAVYGLFLLQKENAVRQIIKSSIAVFLGLAATSYYWLAMVSELGWVNHATERFQSNHFYFANRFFPMILHGISGDQASNLISSDILTAVCFLFLISAVVYVFYRRTNKTENSDVSPIYKTVLPLGIFALFMMTPLSYPIWKIITPLQKIQFPMRFMSIVSMCGAIVTASAIYFMIEGDFFKKRIWVYATVIFIALFTVIDGVYMFNPGSFIPIERARFENDLRELPEKQNGIFWWSVWSNEDALKIKEKVLTENRQNTIGNWKPEQRNFTVEAGTPTLARIATFYYPHWKAEVNGNLVSIERDENGAILIPIPAEKASVRLYFEEPFFVKLSSYFSIFAWLVILLTVLLSLRKKLFSSTNSFSQIPKEEFTY